MLVKSGRSFKRVDAVGVALAEKTKHSSAVTCGVWAGFDKAHETIYRGAFSNEIALPIWANVMKETFVKYRPEEIREPRGIIKCELCSASGLLATDKCFETGKQTVAQPHDGLIFDPELFAFDRRA